METSLCMSPNFSRRDALKLIGFALLSSQLEAADKQLRGIFPIMATPFTSSNQVDYEDLEKEVEFMTCCGAHGMVDDYAYNGVRQRCHNAPPSADELEGS